MALQSKRDPDFDARWAGGSREAPPTIGRFVTVSPSSCPAAVVVAVGAYLLLLR